VPDFYDKTHGDEVSQAKSAKVIGKRVGVEVGLGATQPRTVMCVGHNFGFELAARSFCRSENVELKTAHAALLTARGPARSGERAFKVIVAPLDDTALTFEVWNREIRGSTSVMFCVCDVAVCAVIDDAPPERKHHDDAWQRAFTDHKFRLEAVLNPEEPESASEIIKRVVERMIEELIDSDMSMTFNQFSRRLQKFFVDITNQDSFVELNFVEKSSAMRKHASGCMFASHTTNRSSPLAVDCNPSRTVSTASSASTRKCVTVFGSGSSVISAGSIAHTQPVVKRSLNTCVQPPGAAPMSTQFQSPSIGTRPRSNAS
jgi:hypothetical protein